jgi:hypothetical protein
MMGGFGDYETPGVPKIGQGRGVDHVELSPFSPYFTGYSRWVLHKFWVPGPTQ